MSRTPDGRAKEIVGEVFSAPDLGCRRDGCRGFVNRLGSLAEGGEVGLAEHASQVPGRMDDEADLVATPGALGDAPPGPLRKRDQLRLYGPEGLPAAENRRGPLDPGRQTTGVGSHKHLGSAHPAAKAQDTPHDPSPLPFSCVPIPQRSPEKKNARLPLLQRESRASLPPGATPHGVPGIPLRAKKCLLYVLRHLPIVNRQLRSACENPRASGGIAAFQVRGGCVFGYPV